MYGKSVPEIMKQLAQRVEHQLYTMMTEYNSSTYANETSTLTYEDVIRAKEELIRGQKQVQCLPKVLETSHMVERVLTKKPRKKKNRRWDKKYWKKYSKLQPRKDYIYDKINNVIYCHPATLVKTQRLLNK